MRQEISYSYLVRYRRFECHALRILCQRVRKFDLAHSIDLGGGERHKGFGRRRDVIKSVGVGLFAGLSISYAVSLHKDGLITFDHNDGHARDLWKALHRFANESIVSRNKFLVRDRRLGL